MVTKSQALTLLLSFLFSGKMLHYFLKPMCCYSASFRSRLEQFNIALSNCFLSRRKAGQVARA